MYIEKKVTYIYRKNMIRKMEGVWRHINKKYQIRGINLGKKINNK